MLLLRGTLRYKIIGDALVRQKEAIPGVFDRRQYAILPKHAYCDLFDTIWKTGFDRESHRLSSIVYKY